MMIRSGEVRDLPALLAIYNDEVENGVATFDLHPKSLEDWHAWYDAHQEGNHILLVADETGEAVGYATLSAYREKEAYKSTVELSIYISRAHRGKGIATALMGAILDKARADETVHVVVSVITSGNQASIRLHEKFGFTFCGTMHELGWKKGEYRSIDNFELMV